MLSQSFRNSHGLRVSIVSVTALPLLVLLVLQPLLLKKIHFLLEEVETLSAATPLDDYVTFTAKYIFSEFLSPCLSRLRLKCDGTRAETRFRLSAKRTSPFKSAPRGGGSVQSTTGSRGVRISGNNAGYAMFLGRVKSTGYPLHSPVPPSLSQPVRRRVPSRYNWTLYVSNTLKC